jgi:hypothetical protein
MTIESERMKIVEKVIKLLALANSTTHDGEADNAKRMAAELMAKHDINMGECKREECKIHEMGLCRKNHESNEQRIMNMISELNGVKMYRSKGFREASYVLVGRDADIEVTKYMYEILCHQMSNDSKRFSAEQKQRHGECKASTWAHYRNGWIIGLRQKIDELTAMKNSKIQEWGLVPVSNAVAAANFYEENHKTTAGRSQSRTYLNRGVTDGKNASIHTGIGGKSATKKIAHK